MPTFFRFEGIKIDLYYKDHAPPHFHAIYAEYEELIEINTLTTIRGSLPTKKHKRVKQWAINNQSILLEIWESLQ